MQSDILPSVKKAVAIEGDNVVLEGKVALAFPENFAGEAKLLKEKLTGLYGLEVVGNASVKIVLEELLDRKEAVNDEYYTINIGDNLIKISAATPHGIFNGTQTLFVNVEGQADTLFAGGSLHSGLSGLGISWTNDRYCP